MTEIHGVNSGDCLLSLGLQYGIPWKKIWEEPENQALKYLRKDPSVLSAGDSVTVPMRDISTVQGHTSQRHRFKAKGRVAELNLRLRSDGQDLKAKPFRLIIGNQVVSGKSDSQGFVKAKIPQDAKEGLLRVTVDTGEILLPLEFGRLDPLSTESGVRQRLVQLGFNADVSLAEAIRIFQRKVGLSVTGLVDEDLRRRLKEEYGQ